jgi:hypothetical protein
MPPGEEGAREELVRFERRELCAFFKANHGNASAVAAQRDRISLFRFMLASNRLDVRRLRRKQELRASLAESPRGIRLPYQAIVNLRWRQSHKIVKKI